MNNGRFQYWIWFGLIFTIFPIILTVWKLRGVAPDDSTLLMTIKAVISRGELMLVSLSILGANLGDLFKEECKNRTIGYTIQAITFLLCLFAIGSFSEINTNLEIKKDFAFHTSVTIFICSVLISSVSVFIPRKEK
jgi:cobalamin synthase